jgi:hypothetical protein
LRNLADHDGVLGRLVVRTPQDVQPRLRRRALHRLSPGVDVIELFFFLTDVGVK